MAGVSLVELMVGITLGLLVLAGLASVFANSSRSRTDIERASRQIENGRYALQVLSDDIRLAGFYGEFNPNILNAYYGTFSSSTPDQDACSTDPTLWLKYTAIPFYGFDNGLHAPTCMPSNLKANTDIIVIRRVSACEAGVAGCAAAVIGKPYFQSSKCGSVDGQELQSVNINDYYRFGLYGSGTNFDRHAKDCATVAGLRLYMEHIYYIATDNGQGQSVPTLTRLELNPNAPAGFDVVPLVEGIEQMNIEYGIDWDKDGQPDGYTADPSNYTPAGCPAGSCAPARNWEDVVSARINILARSVDPTPNYTNQKTYTLGLDALGQPINYTFSDNYQRHAYFTVVRVENVSQRRDIP
jgi:type IV pilus assembly protein PilW